MPGIDFKKLRTELLVIEVLRSLQVPFYVASGGSLRTRCPHECTQGRDAKRIVAMLISGEWFCHKCKSCGDIVDYYAYKRGIELYKAALEICNQFRIPVPFLKEGK